MHWTALPQLQKSLADTVTKQLRLPEFHLISKICVHLWKTVPTAILKWKLSLFQIANDTQERMIFKTWALSTRLIKSRNSALQVKHLSTSDRRTKLETEKQRKECGRKIWWKSVVWVFWVCWVFFCFALVCLLFCFWQLIVLWAVLNGTISFFFPSSFTQWILRPEGYLIISSEQQKFPYICVLYQHWERFYFHFII